MTEIFPVDQSTLLTWGFSFSSSAGRNINDTVTEIVQGPAALILKMKISWKILFLKCKRDGINTTQLNGAFLKESPGCRGRLPRESTFKIVSA